MASTFYPTTKYSSGYGKGIGTVQSVGAVWNRGTTALVINDVLAGPVVPKNARILLVTLTTNDCEDSTGALTLSVGDSGSTARFISASTVGRAGGVSTTMAVGGICYKYTAATAINVLVAAAATAAGVSDPQYICLKVDYIIEEETA